MTYLNKLDLELAKLQQISKTKKHFKIEWIPQEQSSIEGKVEGDTITIYSENIEDALDTLDLLRNYQQNASFNQTDSSGHGITTKSFCRILKLTRPHMMSLMQS